VVFIVHGTQRFLDRARGPFGGPDDTSDTSLGAWYANVLFWKPQVALFVNEKTLLPVLMSVAPAATVVDRFPASLSDVLLALGVDRRFTEAEVTRMAEHRLAKTNSRSVLGTMNDFVFMAEHIRRRDDSKDLLALSLWLAQTPCSPLFKRHGSPDRELAALVAQHLG